jgi:hypothetical protein
VILTLEAGGGNGFAGPFAGLATGGKTSGGGSGASSAKGGPKLATGGALSDVSKDPDESGSPRVVVIPPRSSLRSVYRRNMLVAPLNLLRILFRKKCAK